MKMKNSGKMKGRLKSPVKNYKLNHDTHIYKHFTT